MLRVIFLGRFADHFGRTQMVEVSPEQTAGEILARFDAKHPDAGLSKPTTTLVLDNEVVGREQCVAGGQELAFLPIMSGG